MPKKQVAQELKGYGETVMTPEIRMTMPFLTEKNSFQGKEQSWQVTGLVPKDDEETLGFFNELLCSYYEVDDLDDIPSHPFVNGKSGSLNDGDAEAFAEYQGYKEHLFFKATSNLATLFEALATEVEMDGSPIEETGQVNPETGNPVRLAEASEFHAGCFVRFVINCKEYEEGMVKFYLQGLVKTKRGDVWAMGKGAAKSLLGLTSAKLTPGLSNGASKEAAQQALATSARKKTGAAALTASVKAPKAQVEEEEAAEGEEQEEQEAAPARKRGRPAKAGSAFGAPHRPETIAKRKAVEAAEADEEEEDETDDTPTPPARRAPAPAKKAGRGGLSSLLQRPNV